MRIVAGRYRGKVLRTPKGMATRPTLGKVREALFSIIAGDIAGARVLDLFAGSGALGIEALSRGADEATFVDKSAQACRLIRGNLEDVGEPTRVLQRNALAALRDLSAHETTSFPRKRESDRTDSRLRGNDEVGRGNDEVVRGNDEVVRGNDEVVRGNDEVFDLVFLDPPYGRVDNRPAARNKAPREGVLLQDALNALAKHALVAPGGLVVCEHAAEHTPPAAPDDFTIEATRRYGEVALTFLRREA